MKYRAIIADDEPLVLVGLQSMVKWEELDTHLVATARNGNELLDLIHELKPDFVILDIKMPGKSGLEVMRCCREEGLALPCFLLLTSSEEFEYAREAMKYDAVDYLVKLELTPEILTDAVRRTQQRADKRGESRPEAPEAPFLDKFYLRLLTGGLHGEALEKEAAGLGIQDLSGKCAVACLELAMAEDRPELSFSVVSFLSESMRLPCQVLPLDMRHAAVIFFLSEENARHYVGYIAGALGKAMEMSESYFSVPLRASVGTVTELRKAKQSYDEARLTTPSGKPAFASGSGAKDELDLSPWQKDLNSALIEGDGTQVRALLDTIAEELLSQSASPLAAVYAASSLLYLVTNTLADGENLVKEAFSSAGDDYRSIYRATDAREASCYLRLLGEKVETALADRKQDYRARLVLKVQQYIKDNLSKKLSLAEVASVFGISQNYLSALFPKYAGQGFVEYITKEKIKEAKRMMGEGNHLIYDIAASLGYDSAFYFSKVFKKAEGLSPSEYIKGLS